MRIRLPVAFVFAVLSASPIAGPRRLRIGSVSACKGSISLLVAGKKKQPCKKNTVVYAGDVVVLGGAASLTIQQSNGMSQAIGLGRTVLRRLPSPQEIAYETEIEGAAKIAAKSRGGMAYPGPGRVPAVGFFVMLAGRADPIRLTFSDGETAKAFDLRPDATGCYSDKGLTQWIAQRINLESLSFRVGASRTEHRVTLISSREETALEAALAAADKRSDEVGQRLARARVFAVRGFLTPAARELALASRLDPEQAIRTALKLMTAQGYWP